MEGGVIKWLVQLDDAWEVTIRFGQGLQQQPWELYLMSNESKSLNEENLRENRKR